MGFTLTTSPCVGSDRRVSLKGNRLKIVFPWDCFPLKDRFLRVMSHSPLGCPPSTRRRAPTSYAPSDVRTLAAEDTRTKLDAARQKPLLFFLHNNNNNNNNKNNNNSINKHNNHNNDSAKQRNPRDMGDWGLWGWGR